MLGGGGGGGGGGGNEGGKLMNGPFNKDTFRTSLCRALHRSVSFLFSSHCSFLTSSQLGPALRMKHKRIFLCPSNNNAQTGFAGKV